MTLCRHLKSCLLLGTVMLAACSESAVDTPATDSAPTYNLTLNMTEFMAHVLEPTADGLWRSAGWVLDEVDGYYELYPTDDEGWQRVENLAAREQDEEAIFQAGAQLYSVCTACHQAFNPEILSRFAPGSLAD